MTREEAKKTLQDMWGCLFNEMTNHTFEDLKEHGMLDNYATAFDMAISALSAEPCEDCISRQAVIEHAKASYRVAETFEELANLYEDNVKSLPSVQPKRASG